MQILQNLPEGCTENMPASQHCSIPVVLFASQDLKHGLGHWVVAFSAREDGGEWSLAKVAETKPVDSIANQCGSDNESRNAFAQPSQGRCSNRLVRYEPLLNYWTT